MTLRDDDVMAVVMRDGIHDEVLGDVEGVYCAVVAAGDNESQG